MFGMPDSVTDRHPIRRNIERVGLEAIQRLDGENDIV